MRERIILDPLYFIEMFCSVIDYGESRGIVPFMLNQAQRRYVEDIWLPGVQRDVVGKSRKWGFSTLRIALGLHGTMFTKGWTFRVVAHRQRTADELSKTIKTIYDTARKQLQDIGQDPDYFLPRVTADRASGLEFGTIRSSVQVDTAGGKGVGQSDRNDDVYATEYSDWEWADAVYAGLAGSQPKGSPHTRFTIDFNAHGTGSDAYLKYTRAKLPHDSRDWNGFVPFFAGIYDCPELYPPEQMDLERRALGRRFPEVYPGNDAEMWLSNALAVFDGGHVDAALGRSGGQYAGPCVAHLHGVDTSGGALGLDSQCCVTLGLVDGRWVEAAPPIHGHWPEDVFAEMVHERVREYPGVCVVERNVGSAVLVKLRELGTSGLYKHRHKDKTGKQYMQLGFPTSYATKKIMVSVTTQMLREETLDIVTPLLAQQLKEVEWKVREGESGIEEATDMFDSPRRVDSDGAGTHGDMAMGLMLALQGVGQVVTNGNQLVQYR